MLTLDRDELVRRSPSPTAHRRSMPAGTRVRLVPLRLGTRAVGLLAVAGRPVESGTLDALAGLPRSPSSGRNFSTSAKRRNWRDERGTEIRAPRIARPRPADAADRHSRRRRQPAGVVAERPGTAGTERPDLGGVERLTRLFQNILEMARIDAGAVAGTPWVDPSEIVEAAREPVEHALRAIALCSTSNRSGWCGSIRA